MAVSEVRSWRKAFLNYRATTCKITNRSNCDGVADAINDSSDIANNKMLAMLEMARPISFLISTLSYVDVALLTLFAQDMLAGGNLAENTILLALPLTVVYLAYLISGPVRVFVVRRLGLRNAFLLGCAGITAGFLATAGSIALGNFAFFVAMVFVYRVFLYLLISCGRLMPTLAPTERSRTDINIETDNADVSASALMGVVVGYAAQYLGNLSVYFVALAPLVALVVFVCKFVPREGVQNNSAPENFASNSRRHKSVADISDCDAQGCKMELGQKSVQDSLLNISCGDKDVPISIATTPTIEQYKKPSLRSFIFHPAMVSLFFFALITLGFSACYRSYLFPLFATDAGLNKADISNLTVICSVVVFYTAPPLTRLAHRLGSRNLLVWVLVVCAVTFLGFVVVQNAESSIASFVWSAIALLLVILIKKVGEPCTRTLWPRVADAKGVSRHDAQAAYEVMDGIICFAKMPVTGALLTLGNVGVCAIFGVYSAASAFLFYITTLRGPFGGREIRKVDEESVTDAE